MRSSTTAGVYAVDDVSALRRGRGGSDSDVLSIPGVSSPIPMSTILFIKPVPDGRVRPAGSALYALPLLLVVTRLLSSDFPTSVQLVHRVRA